MRLVIVNPYRQRALLELGSPGFDLRYGLSFLFPVSHDFEMVAARTKEHVLEAEKKVRRWSE